MWRDHICNLLNIHLKRKVNKIRLFTLNLRYQIVFSNCNNYDGGCFVELVQQQGGIHGLVATSISLPVVSSVPAIFTNQMPQQPGNMLLIIERHCLIIVLYRIRV
jgi:hypothetical protein